MSEGAGHRYSGGEADEAAGGVMVSSGGGPLPGRYIAPDFKRRQLIFDSFSKLKESNARAQRGAAGGSSGVKGTLLYAWGAGYHGQLGLSSYRKKCKLVPAWIEFKESVIQVACGGFHTAVLTESGKVYTWGDGRMGQLGNLARKHNMHATPHIVDKLAEMQVVQISCGQYHTACITSRGEMYSWGSGKYGQLGHATRLDQRYPVLVEVDATIGPFKQVSCGDRHTAAVTRSNKVVTFGSGQHGQLGHGSGLDFLKPKIVEALSHEKVREVTSGATHTCAVTDNGALYLWGFGESLHPKEFTNIVDTPRVVKMREKVKQVAAGQSHVLVLTETGDVYGLGTSNMGQIGTGFRSNVRNPRLVLKGKEVMEIAAGRYHSMAVTAYGVLYSWGCGESGQLAHNSLENEFFPRVVKAILPNVVGQICCGEHHSFCLSSIEHSTVSQDVADWYMIEEAELAFKKSMLTNYQQFPDAVNGLKDKHVILVEKERERITAEIDAKKQKDREAQERHLQEQLDSITGPDALMQDVQEKQKATDGATLDLQVAALNQLREKEDPLQKSGTRSPTNGKGKSARGVKSMGVSKSTPALRVNNRRSRGRGPLMDQEEEGEEQLSPLPASSASHAPGKHALRPIKAADDSAHGIVTWNKPSQNNADGRPQTSHSTNGAEPLAFQPVLPRMAFMEKTTAALARVKKYIQTGALKAQGVSSKELFDSKSEYNLLRAESLAKQQELEALRNQYVFMRPTEEDNHRMTSSQLRIKELNMKLVTLNTRLMESDENKRNYELYIIRMKEEDVQLSKQIDHLRQLVSEYDRLLTKMEKMNNRVMGQKKDIDEEIIKFNSDIESFSSFAKEQLVKYRQLINRNAAEARMAEKMVLERENKLDERRTKRLIKLQGEFSNANEEATEIKTELDEWQEKVQFYEARFHKITSATGLTQADEIINKFFFNDEITEDLSKDIKEREKQIETVLNEKQDIIQRLDDYRTNYVQSKWRDVDVVQDKLDDDNLRVARRKEELDQITQKLAFVQEGMVALASLIEDQFGPDPKGSRPPEDHTDSAHSQVRWWINFLERRIGNVSEVVYRNNKTKQKDQKKKDLKAQIKKGPAPTSQSSFERTEEKQLEYKRADD